MLAVIVIASAVALGGGVMTFAIGIPGSPCAGIVGTTRSFTLIADLNGFNDSRDHQSPWPVLTVHRCDVVSIKIINKDTQAHGFAIDYYAARGTEIPGQQPSTPVQFLASKSGQFKIFCNIYCTVHIFMQNALLNVV